MFRRRTPRSTLGSLARLIWPQGGWLRAGRYMVYRIRRLPDPAYKISRGIACGVFVCFTPLFGLHFFISAAIAWLIRGNVLAAILATFFGNPITFPIIAGLSVGVGSRLLGISDPVPLARTFDSFSRVSVELWHNAEAIFTAEPVLWDHSRIFLDAVFLPYMVGGTIIGLPVAILSYALSRPLIGAYQAARINRMKRAFDRRRKAGQGREGRT